VGINKGIDSDSRRSISVSTRQGRLHAKSGKASEPVVAMALISHAFLATVSGGFRDAQSFWPAKK
jgi:hypothetical protein